MAATFPESKKTFSQLVDGTTYMEGVNVNVAYDEVEAIETLIGALGRAQSYSESLKNLLLSYKSGCGVEYKSAADLYVRAGEITIPSAAGNAAYRRNTSDLTVTWANLDTGAEANSTLYYVYAVADAAGTTFTVKISTSSSAPTGCTYYKQIGSFYNNASGDIDRDSVTDLPVNCFFGDWETKSVTTIYQARTDGYAVAIGTATNATADVTGYTDNNANPTTVREYGYDRFDVGNTPRNAFCGICMPVKKDDYWKVTKGGDTTATVYWIPKKV